jgi:hypothetical protein
MATVLDHNARMLKLARDLGFVEDLKSSFGEGVKSIVLPPTFPKPSTNR